MLSLVQKSQTRVLEKYNVELQTKQKEAGAKY